MDYYCAYLILAVKSETWGKTLSAVTSLSLLPQFDPVIGHFNGHATVDPADAKTYQLGTDNSSHGNADKSSLGGCVSVLQGTGAGQYRRFVSTDAKSSSVTLDAPFATALDETSIMQVTHGLLELQFTWRISAATVS